MGRNYPKPPKADVNKPVRLTCCRCRNYYKIIWVPKNRKTPRTVLWCGVCYEAIYPGTNERLEREAKERTP